MVSGTLEAGSKGGTGRSWIAQVLAAVGLAVGLFGVFLLVNFIHFRFFEVRVVLYAAMSDAFIAGGLVALVLLFVALRNRTARPVLGLTGLEAALAWSCGVLAATNFAVLFPAVVDRSLSVYLVEKLDQRGGSIAQDKLETIFIKEYLPAEHVVDVRLTEQLKSGTIRVENGCVSLTPRGERAVAFAQAYRRTFLPRHRRILDKVTDSLTNPVDKADAPNLTPYPCPEAPR